MCDLLRQYLQSAPLLWQVLQNILNQMDTHQLPCTLALKQSLPPKPADQHQEHHHDPHLHPQIAPKLLIFLHQILKMRFQELLEPLDHLVRYSSFANKHNCQHLYRWQRKYLGLTLSQVHLLSLADLVQLTAVAMPRWQLRPLLFCHAQVPALNRQVIYQFQFRLELRGDDDQIVH